MQQLSRPGKTMASRCTFGAAVLGLSVFPMVSLAGDADALTHKRTGLGYLQAGAAGKAREEFQIAAGLDPDNAELQDLLGVALGDSGDLSGAAAQFRKAVEVDSKAYLPHFHLAVLAYRLGRTAEAVNEFQLTLVLKPDYVPARYALSAVCLDISDVDGALALLRDVLPAVSGSAEAHHNFGVALRRKGHLEQEAIHEFQVAIQIDPAYLRAYYVLGQLLADTGDVSGAVDVFRKAVSRAPSDAESHYNLALALRLGNNIDEAEKEFRTALKLEPRYPLAHRALGLLLRQKDDVIGAAEELRAATAQLPQDAQCHYNLGAILLRQGETDAAIKELETATALDTLLPEAGYLLAQALGKAGQQAEAERAKERAAQTDDRKRKAGRSIILLQMAAQNLKTGDHNAGVAALREATHVTPDFPEAHYQLALSLADSPQDRAESARALQTVLALKPNHADAHYRLGLLLEAEGNAAALREYDQAVAIAPGLSDARRRLADLTARSGDWTAAVAQYRNLLAWSPGDLQSRLGLAHAFVAQKLWDDACIELTQIIARSNRADPREAQLAQAAQRELDGLKLTR